MSILVMFQQESKYDPKAWLAGRMTTSCMPLIFVLLGVKPKLRPLFPKLAEWHFNFLSPKGIPFNAFIAFYPQACYSYYMKQYPFETPPSLTRLKNLSLPKVQHIFLTCSSLKERGNPPKQILLSDPIDFKSFFFTYFSWKKSLGFNILKVVSLQLNSGCVLKKSLTLLEERVRIAKVFALSNQTSLIGRGMASSGLDAAMTVLKYWKTSSIVMVKGRLLQISLSGWFSAIEYLVFYQAESSATLQSSDVRASYFIFYQSISLGFSLSLFFFFFFFFSFSTRVPYSSFQMTDSLTSLGTYCVNCSISYNQYESQGEKQNKS